MFPNQIDVEFGRLFDGKGEMFLRKWESSFPRMKSIALLETSIAPLVDQTGNLNDGKNLNYLIYLLLNCDWVTNS